MSSKKLTQIGFCFENFETVFVPVSCFEFFLLRNIHHDYQMFRHEEMMDMTCCEEALFVMKPEAETKALLLYDSLDYNAVSGSAPKFSLFKRLEGLDCVSVELYYDTAGISVDKEVIYIPWQDGKNEFTNSLQTFFKQDDKKYRGFGGYCVHFGSSWELIEKPAS